MDSRWRQTPWCLPAGVAGTASQFTRIALAKVLKNRKLGRHRGGEPQQEPAATCPERDDSVGQWGEAAGVWDLSKVALPGVSEGLGAGGSREGRVKDDLWSLAWAKEECGCHHERR